jgi:hypothetical protein
MALNSPRAQPVFGPTADRFRGSNAHAPQPGDVAALGGRHDRHRRTKFPWDSKAALPNFAAAGPGAVRQRSRY